MELQQIRYFLAIHEHGGFSRAARELDVSQPALTAAIKKLEADIGAALFHREGRRLVLTELGGLVKPHFEQALGGTHAARDVARNFRLLRKVPLRLGVMATIGPVRVSRFFRAFHERHEGVELTVRDAVLPVLLQELERGELDLAIISAPNGLSEVFRSQPLYRERFAFMPEYSVRLSGISQRPLIDPDRQRVIMSEFVLAAAQAAPVHFDREASTDFASAV